MDKENNSPKSKEPHVQQYYSKFNVSNRDTRPKNSFAAFIEECKTDKNAEVIQSCWNEKKIRNDLDSLFYSEDESPLTVGKALENPFFENKANINGSKQS